MKNTIIHYIGIYKEYIKITINNTFLIKNYYYKLNLVIISAREKIRQIFSFIDFQYGLSAISTSS